MCLYLFVLRIFLNHLTSSGLMDLQVRLHLAETWADFGHIAVMSATFMYILPSYLIFEHFQTYKAYEGRTANILFVVNAVHPSSTVSHRCNSMMLRIFFQLSTHHKLVLQQKKKEEEEDKEKSRWLKITKIQKVCSNQKIPKYKNTTIYCYC